jgi:hypothetical protein
MCQTNFRGQHVVSECARWTRAIGVVGRGQSWGNQHVARPQVAAPPEEVHEKALYATTRSAFHDRSVR